MPNREFCQSGHTVNAELPHEPISMGFHGSHSKTQLASDFLVAETFGYMDEYLALALG